MNANTSIRRSTGMTPAPIAGAQILKYLKITTENLPGMKREYKPYKKLTNGQLRACLMEASRLQVPEWLGWSDADHAHFLYECGLKYLELYQGGDVECIEIMSGSRVFWNWWKYMWYLRDQEWLDLCEQAYWAKKHGGAGLSPEVREQLTKMVAQETRVASYYQLHNADALADERTPHGSTLDKSYCHDLVPALTMK